MEIVQALLLAFFGIGLVWVAWRAEALGEIPAGTSLLRPHRPRRDQDPLAFRAFQALYVAGGAALALYAVLLATGAAEPLSWR